LKLWKAFLRDLLNLFLPPACLVCGQRIEEQTQVICEICETKISLMGQNVCPVCGTENPGIPCELCAEEHFAFASAGSVFKFQGPVKDLIHELKYNGYSSPAGYFALPLSEMIESSPDLKEHDYICAVPLHRVRKRERGFNQSELIAYATSVMAGIPYAETVYRSINTYSQTLLSKARRVSNLKDAFKIKKNADVNGKKIIVIDDVFTTGSTLNEVAKTLCNAGAAKVTALTVARA